MRTGKTFVILLFATGLLYTSCKKYRLNRDTTTSQDNATADNMYTDAFSVVDDGAKDNGKIEKTSQTNALDSCATINNLTVDTGGSELYVNFLIDFGNTNCKGEDGKTRRGQLDVEYTLNYSDSTVHIAFTPQDYYVDDHHIEGTVSMDADNKNNPIFVYKVKDGKITTPKGEVIMWETTRTHEMVEGSSTPINKCDNKWEITGEASGTNRKGRNFTAKITDPLIYKGCCEWIVQGVLELTPEDLQTRTIDYGDGTCDNDATVQIKNRTYNIKL